MMKRNKRGEIRDKWEKLGLKGGRRSLMGDSRSTSVLLKLLHTLKEREITFGSTSAKNI